MTRDRFPITFLLYCFILLSVVRLCCFVCFGELSKCGVLPYCISVPIVYYISTPIVYFSDSATSGPKLGIKLEWRKTLFIPENCEKVGFLTWLEINFRQLICYIVFMLTSVVWFSRFLYFGELSKCGVLPYCISTPIVYYISTPLVDFSNSATSGPKPGIKIE